MTPTDPRQAEEARLYAATVLQQLIDATTHHRHTRHTLQKCLDFVDAMEQYLTHLSDLRSQTEPTLLPPAP